jgi:hypothetical protein
MLLLTTCMNKRDSDAGCNDERLTQVSETSELDGEGLEPVFTSNPVLLKLSDTPQEFSNEGSYQSSRHSVVGQAPSSISFACWMRHNKGSAYKR